MKYPLIEPIICKEIREYVQAYESISVSQPPPFRITFIEMEKLIEYFEPSLPKDLKTHKYNPIKEYIGCELEVVIPLIY